MASTTPGTFRIKCTPGIPALLFQLKATIAISTYQAGKVIFLSAPTPQRLIQLPRSFPKPMGIGLCNNNQTLALALRDSVVIFQNSAELAWHYPAKPQTYDALYLPRMAYLTNPLDIHDLDWVGEDLMAVNTLFSCIIKLSASYNFEVVWKPPFITHIASEDRCHLNGLAAENSELKYATAFSASNTPMGWKDTIPNSGIIIDIPTGEIIATDLAMPHSPKIILGNLYVLLSATGQVMQVDRDDGTLTEVTRIKGFVRGMAYEQGYLFVAHSKIRRDSSSFGKLQLQDQESPAGITVIQLNTGAIIGEINYADSVEEIYDLRILSDIIRPNILNNQKEESKLAISTPGKTYWGRPQNQADEHNS
jgi:uncharacterized protein (TIGR03032 family)